MVSTSAIPDRLVDKGGGGYPFNDGFTNLFLNSKDSAQREHVASASRIPVKMERASTSTSDVSVVPCKVSMPNTKERRRLGEIAVLPSHTPGNPGLVPLPTPHHKSITPVPLPEIETANTNSERDSTTPPTRSGMRYTSDSQSSTSGKGARRTGNTRRRGIRR